MLEAMTVLLLLHHLLLLVSLTDHFIALLLAAGRCCLPAASTVCSDKFPTRIASMVGSCFCLLDLGIATATSRRRGCLVDVELDLLRIHMMRVVVIVVLILQ